MDRERDGITTRAVPHSQPSLNILRVLDGSGMPVTALRELRILQACDHPHIVRLKRVVTGRKAHRYDSTKSTTPRRDQKCGGQKHQRV
eukprot:4537139-Pyramimonas_sp.AAC.1